MKASLVGVDIFFIWSARDFDVEFVGVFGRNHVANQDISVAMAGVFDVAKLANPLAGSDTSGDGCEIAVRSGVVLSSDSLIGGSVGLDSGVGVAPGAVGVGEAGAGMTVGDSRDRG